MSHLERMVNRITNCKIIIFPALLKSDGSMRNEAQLLNRCSNEERIAYDWLESNHKRRVWPKKIE